MPKGRHLKVETWTDDKFVTLSPMARLLFMGMWNYACDNGHIEDNSVQLKMRILPMDAADVPALLDEMIATGQVERGDGFLKVAKLTEHQRIDLRYLTLCEWCAHDVHTVFSEADRPPRPSRAQRANDGGTTGAQRGHTADGDGDGDGDESCSAPADENPPAPSAKPTTSKKKPAKPMPEDWRPNDKHLATCKDRGLNPKDEFAKFCAYAEANDRRQVSWNAAFTQWLLNARPPGGTVHHLPTGTDDSWMARRPK